MAVEMRETMKGFFTVLKGSDPYIRLLLLTGVSKFSKSGVFGKWKFFGKFSFPLIMICISPRKDIIRQYFI